MNRAQFVGAASAIALASGSYPARSATLSRSLWVWRTPLAEANSLASFAQRNQFRSIFLSVTSAERTALAEGDVASLAAVRSLGRDERSVYAVAGDPSWVKHGHADPPDSVRT